MPSKLGSILVLVAAAALSTIHAQTCVTPSTGAVPLTDLGSGLYQGRKGGLYPDGSNVRPAAHEVAGLEQAAAIVPLDLQGNPSVDGRVVFLSIGMSNATQEFEAFLPVVETDPDHSEMLVTVNGAQPNWSAFFVANPAASYWNWVDTMLASRGVGAQQVQVIWMKEAVAHPTGGLAMHTAVFHGYLVTICQIIKSRFPNCRLCYLSSRAYGGYSSGTLSPEPYAYEEGFAVKQVIEDQINGDPMLNFDANAGPVLSPWLSWGPYLWADGISPRSDGLTYLCSDFQSDGVHPSVTGEAKVAGLLHQFFTTDSTASIWYGAPSTGGALPPMTIHYGSACPGTYGDPLIGAITAPYLGNPNWVSFLIEARHGAPAFLYLSSKSAQIPFGGHYFPVDPGHLILPSAADPSAYTTSGGGSVPFILSIPTNPALDQVSVYATWLILDPQGQAPSPLGNLAWTRGMQIRFALP